MLLLLLLPKVSAGGTERSLKAIGPVAPRCSFETEPEGLKWVERERYFAHAFACGLGSAARSCSLSNGLDRAWLGLRRRQPPPALLDPLWHCIPQSSHGNSGSTAAGWLAPYKYARGSTARWHATRNPRAAKTPPGTPPLLSFSSRLPPSGLPFLFFFSHRARAQPALARWLAA